MGIEDKTESKLKNKSNNLSIKKRHIIESRKAFIAIMKIFVLVYITLILYFISDSPYTWDYFMYFSKKYFLVIIGSIITIIVMYKNLTHLIPIIGANKNFQDVDKEYKKEITTEVTERKNNPASMNNSLSNENELSTTNETIIQEIKHMDKAELNFYNYFIDLKNVLEHKSQIADEKASILLDKGTSYAKGGIIFYILSIISWQIIGMVWGEFKPQMIYGIISCSFLFLFIEFLSAWFLKQYRHFVDTSTYLIKVKSIFDKYLLIVLYAKETNSEISHEDIINHLAEEIHWPDISNFSRREISFAKEALDSASMLIKNLQVEKKEETK